MTNLDLINDALMLIAVLPEGQTATAEQGALGLRVAGELVDEWADDGITINWDVSGTLADNCPAFGAELSALKYGVAVRLCPYFGRDPSQTLVALSAGAVTKLTRQQIARTLEPVSVPMPSSAGQGWYDITTDEIG